MQPPFALNVKFPPAILLLPMSEGIVLFLFLPSMMQMACQFFEGPEKSDFMGFFRTMHLNWEKDGAKTNQKMLEEKKIWCYNAPNRGILKNKGQNPSHETQKWCNKAPKGKRRRFFEYKAASE